MSKPQNILVIGDSHAKPGVSVRRFTWLGRMICDLKPDIVVDMGDWADMPSLSSYDGSSLTGNKAKTKQFEGRSYRLDIEASVLARDLVQREFRKSKRKKPRLIALGGNHDDERITRALNLVPELNGTISIADHQRAEYGWEHVPFLEPVDVQGFMFSHYFTTGVMGKPVGGETPAYTMLRKQFCSSVGAHSHLFDEAHRTTAQGKKIQAFIAGCYLDPMQHEEYAGNANKMWDRGLLWIGGAQDGVATNGFSWFSIDRIKAAYGQ